jgi:hypothetical protein
VKDHHPPGFFGVGKEVILLAFFGEFRLPFSFGFPFSLRRFYLAFLGALGMLRLLFS